MYPCIYQQQTASQQSPDQDPLTCIVRDNDGNTFVDYIAFLSMFTKETITQENGTQGKKLTIDLLTNTILFLMYFYLSAPVQLTIYLYINKKLPHIYLLLFINIADKINLT